MTSLWYYVLNARSALLHSAKNLQAEADRRNDWQMAGAAADLRKTACGLERAYEEHVCRTHRRRNEGHAESCITDAQEEKVSRRGAA